MNTFREMTGFKNNSKKKKSVACLYINEKRTENEMRENNIFHKPQII